MLEQIKWFLSDVSGFFLGIRRVYTLEIEAKNWETFKGGGTIHQFVDKGARLEHGTVVKYQCFQHTGKAEVVEEEWPIFCLGKVRRAFRIVVDREERRKRRES
jgi:hypothetical protein